MADLYDLLNARGMSRHTQSDNRVIVLATSLGQHNNLFVSGAAFQYGDWTRGWMTWAKALLPRVRFDTWYDTADANGRNFTGANHGVSGQTCDQIIARLSGVIAMRPAVVIVDAGTNDVGGMDKDALHAKRVTICETLRAAGIFVLLMPILARGTETYAVNTGATRVAWNAGSSTRKQANYINHLGRSYAAKVAGVAWLDWNDGWINPLNLNGEPYAGYSNDGTHFMCMGAYAVGKKVAACLQSILPDLAGSYLSLDDKYDATDNPLGNRFLNQAMATGLQTAGVAGTGVTGTVADLLTMQTANGTTTTVAASVIARAAGENPQRGNWQHAVVTPAGSAVETLQFRPSTADLVTGLSGDANWWEAGCDFKTNANPACRGHEMFLDLRSSSTSIGQIRGMWARDPDTSSAKMLHPNEAYSLSIRTPPFQIPSGADRIRPRFEYSADPTVSTAAHTIDFGGFWLRQVPDPRPIWGLA